MQSIPFLVWLILAPASAIKSPPKPTVEHRMQMTGDRVSPATLQMIQTMIDQQRVSLQQDQSHPRAVLYDAASASNQREHERISGGMLVMVVAVAADAKELPLGGVFLKQPEGNRLPLILVGELPAKLAAQIRLQAPMGSHLWAGIYYAPLAKHLHGLVEADFDAGHSGFALANEMILTPQIMQYSDEHLQDTPSVAALSAMIAREYPGFVVDRDTLKTLEQAH
jgi:hypothetical protein